MAIDVNKIKSLAGEYLQAEARVEKLEDYIKGMKEGSRRISGIYIKYSPSGALVDITSRMDAAYINDMYGVDFIDSMEYEKKDHLKRMDELIQDIKKELQL